MAEQTNYENLEFDPFQGNETVLLNDLTDPDINFYNNEITRNAKYYNPNTDNLSTEIDIKYFSILHLNIRSIQKKFENFKHLLHNLKVTFKIICFTETWCNDINIEKNSNFQLQNYTVIHQIRNCKKKGGGVCMFIHNSILFNLKSDTCANNNDCESLSIEIINKATKNIHMHLLYRSPAGSIENFENHVKNILTDHKGTGKNVYLVGDFNLNVLDFNTNKSVQNFFNSVFQNGFIPLINKPTRVTRSSATAIDHIITNDFTNTTIKTGIIKTDISDHFPIFITSQTTHLHNCSEKIKITKRLINDEYISYYNNLLYCVDWSLVLENNNADKAYEIFLQTFQQQYDQAFPEQTKFVKTKTLLNPWLTKGLLKSSKKKQRLYEKFLKSRTLENEKKYKHFKHLFEIIKRRSKKFYYSGLINKHKNDAKKTWSIINEVIGKTKLSKEKLPKRLNIDGNKIENKCLIAEELNDFFVKAGSNLASQIEPSNLSFKSFLTVNNTQMDNNELSENELFKAIDSLQSNKSPGFDDVNSNVVKQSKNAIKIPLMHIFNLSLLQGYFPGKLKIARVLPVYKTGEMTNVSNYRPISVLPCFSKILERIMYNRFYSFLTANNILYDNQFGFQAGHSTDHAIVKLVNEISKAFDENKYMLGIFIDLSKAFDTVDHKILLEKLKNYGINNSNIRWFERYLSNRKQYISFDGGSASYKTIICGIPQGSILGPLLFLIYVNDLNKASNILHSILFADDTNLFYAHKDIKTLFRTVNNELSKLAEWFKANRLSLNISKTKYTLFHRQNKKDDIPLNIS